MGTILIVQDGIWGMLTEVNNDLIFDKLGNFQSIAVVLAAMLTAYTVLKNSSDYMYGESKFLWPMLRPIVILLCIMDFSIICGALDSVVNIFTREVASEADRNFKDLGTAIEDAFTDLGTHTLDQARLADSLAEEEEWGFWRKLKEGIKLAAGSYFKTKQISVITVLSFSGRLIAEIIFFVYEILASLYLGLLKLLGPIILAISIPEELRRGVMSWLSRYIQISLWVPIGYMIIMLLTGYFQAICTSIVEGGHTSGIFVLGLGLIIAVVAAMMGIPKIASWVIQSSGSANTQSGLERSMQKLLGKITR